MSSTTIGAPPTSRQRRQQETRRALLDAAYDAFTEQGYADASLADIADRAGFTKGAIYASFASKEDLYLALVEDRMAQSLAEWAATDLGAGSGPEVLQSLVGWFATAVHEKRKWHLVNAEFALLAARRPELAARRMTTVHALCHVFEDLLDRAMPGRLSPEEAATGGRLLLAVINGLILYAAADPDADVGTDLALFVRLLTDPTVTTPTARTRQEHTP